MGRKVKRTTDEYRKQVEEKTNGEYELIGDYIYSKEKTEYLHKKCNMKFLMTPNNFDIGQRCPHCRLDNMKKRCTKNKLTTQLFKEKVKSWTNGEYLLLGEYTNAKTQTRFFHNKCMNEFDMQPSNFQQGQRCPFCKGIRMSKSQVKSIDMFKQEVYDLVKDEYTVIDNEYVNSLTPVKFKHNLCNNEFNMRPVDFLRGHRCTVGVCYKKRHSNACSDGKGNSFNEKFKEYEYDYEILSNYVRWNEKIKFRHKICGCVFERTPSTFFNEVNSAHKIKCPDCLKEIIQKEQLLSDNKVKDNIYSKWDYNEYVIMSEYKSSNDTLDILHTKCKHVSHIKYQSAIMRNTLCNYCNNPTRGEKRIINFLDEVMFDEYEFQKYYDDLLGIGGGNLSYDFFLPKYNLLIEYQGNYHDGSVGEGAQTQEQFEIQQEHDRRKAKYAKDHNIDLLEIWYWDFDNIETIINDKLNKIKLLS